MSKLPLVLLTFILLCLGACSPGHNDFNSYQTLPTDGWAYGDTVSMLPDTVDSTATGSLQIAIRHDNSYLYRNLWLEVSYVDNGRLCRDTINMELADVYGRWLGKGFGASYQFIATIPHQVTLTKNAEVGVCHIMRVDTLEGIEQVGVRFIKTDR